MKYFEILEFENKLIMLLKYPISLDENIEIKKELNKVVKRNDVVIDLLIKNGNTSNRFFNAHISNNKIELIKYNIDRNRLEEYVNSYLRKSVYLLLESALSSYEINKILCQY